MLANAKNSVAVTAALTLALIGGSASAAGVQDIPQNEVTHGIVTCNGISSPEEQLACFDAIVESVRAIAPAHDSPGRPSLVSRQAITGASGTIRDATMRAVHPGEPNPNSQSNWGHTGLLEAMEAPSFTDSESLYQRRRDILDSANSMPIEANIVSVQIRHDGRFLVELDNGETWQESRQTRMRPPQPGSPVEIYKEGPGGHRMRIEGNPRIAWVRRSD